jgi:sulfur carrier protein
MTNSPPNKPPQQRRGSATPRIELNGETVELERDATVAAVVERAGVGGERRGVAVAVDGEVVPRSEWQRTELAEGQRVEILGAIQGG